MERKLKITEDYLYIPICVGKKEKKIMIFLEKEEDWEKIYEFMVPVDEDRTEEYICDYFAEIPVRQYLGRQILLCADVPKAFADQVKAEKKASLTIEAKQIQNRPLIHFTANTGWTNDPNGLIYTNGKYHLYFQYNPFHIIWNNMSWGHAVSTDLLHWKQEDTVLFPDENGTIYSGCAITNERGMLGLPKEGILFYYTAAGGTNEWSKGKEFTQKIAYSLDGGKTLEKIQKPCISTLFQENRDPKVFWHEESQAYIMVLWMKENDYAIFRSEDLMHWEQSDQLTLEGAWECPDLFYLNSEKGEGCWFFWAADGFYYPGEFDGYKFRTYAEKMRYEAYINRIPYAAQTYFGTANRVISIPWLRMENDGRLFTGAYGIPVELSCKRIEDEWKLIQKPVRELMQQAKKVDSFAEEDGWIVYKKKGGQKALIFELSAKADDKRNLIWKINGSSITYSPESGQLLVDKESYVIGCGYKEFQLLVDDRILEIFFDGGIKMGTFLLQRTELNFQVLCKQMIKYAFYEVE